MVPNGYCTENTRTSTRTRTRTVPIYLVRYLVPSFVQIWYRYFRYWYGYRYGYCTNPIPSGILRWDKPLEPIGHGFNSHKCFPYLLNFLLNCCIGVMPSGDKYDRVVPLMA
ncbi:hypothetical protein Hanom_Chr11g00968581 [Helianthus anomalus]